MSYFWPDGYRIAVQIDRQGCPIYVLWDWFLDSEAVDMIVDFWAVDDDWWAEPKKRTYYFIVTERGFTAIIFVNVLTQDWYIQWAYD
jgi:hypothetical protein